MVDAFCRSPLKLMNSTIAICKARLPGSCRWLARLLLIVALISCSTRAALATTDQPLFDAPPAVAVSDEILLVSTRMIGTDCNDQSMIRGLRCQHLVRGPRVSSSVGLGAPQAVTAVNSEHWKTTDWRRLLSQQDRRQTILYVHGNRVATGKDRAQGLSIYHSFKAHGRTKGPVRFVIWSWPAEPIAGPIKDYVVKARRTNPAAWQLAWLLDKLPVETQLSLVGYSYGTRVVSGAAHLLAGGRLGNLRLDKRDHPQTPRVRAALLAAAYDADSFQPGKFYSQSLAQIERLVLTTNRLDPAMRFYHLSNGRGRMHALGKSGVHQPTALGVAARCVQPVDFTREVGRSHSLVDYLAAEAKMSNFWHELTRPSDLGMVSPAISHQRLHH